MKDGTEISLSEDDLVFTTLGCNTENSAYGDQNNAPVVPDGIDASWELWENIAAQGKEFGKPKKFYGDVKGSNWESATITCPDGKIPEYIRKLTGRDPYCRKIVTGGPITVKDSSWLMSWTVSRQPHYEVQKPMNEYTGFLYYFLSLISDI